MANPRRIFRVAERVQEIVARELLRCGDPRLALVTITSARVSSDLRNAKLYWTVPEGIAIGAEVLENSTESPTAAEIAKQPAKVDRHSVESALEGATALFRRNLAAELDLRFVPELKFFYDDTYETGQKVEALFRKISLEKA